MPVPFTTLSPAQILAVEQMGSCAEGWDPVTGLGLSKIVRRLHVVLNV